MISTSENLAGLYYVQGNWINGRPQFIYYNKRAHDEFKAIVFDVKISEYNPFFPIAELSLDSKKASFSKEADLSTEERFIYTQKDLDNTAEMYFAPFDHSRLMRETRLSRVEVIKNKILKKDLITQSSYEITITAPITCVELLGNVLFAGAGNKVYIDREEQEEIVLDLADSESVESIYPITEEELYVNYTHRLYKWQKEKNGEWHYRLVSESEYDNKIVSVSSDKIALVSQTRFKVFTKKTNELIFEDFLDVQERINCVKVLETPLKDHFFILICTDISQTVYGCAAKIFNAYNLIQMQ